MLLGAVQATFMLRCLVSLKVMEVGARGGFVHVGDLDFEILGRWFSPGALVPDVAVMVML